MDTVSRLSRAAMAGIEAHALSSERVSDLAATLGVSDRHLRRVTEAELGVSPIELAQTCRLLLAKRLLRETRLGQTEIAFASGFGSVRRFNALFKQRYGLSPRDLRNRTLSTAVTNAAGAKDVIGLTCQLEFRPPLAWQSLLGYLRLRAVPGVETADETYYRRTVLIDQHEGWIAVSLGKSANALEVELSQSLAPVIGPVIARVKQLFDLGALPDAVGAQLSKDPKLAGLVRRFPGLRVPGAFDGFEIAVRAILGQQVSVKGASTLAGRWAHEFGAQIVTPFPELNRLTPTAQRMADAEPAAIAALGIVGTRSRSIVALAQAVMERRVTLVFAADVDAQLAALMNIPGIGPWTAQYIAMRALAWPDAFPSGDLVLQKAAGGGDRELLKRAESWRPWRSYAAHYLWQSMGDPR